MKRLWIALAILILIVVVQSCGLPEPQVFLSPLPSPTPLANTKGIGATSAGCLSYTCEDLETLDLSWAFTWGGGVSTCPGIEKVYMINDYQKVVPQDLSMYSPWLLTFNEPEMYGGNGTTNPVWAANLWRKIELYWPEKFLISPSIVYTYAPNCWWKSIMPTATCYWLDDWHSEYERIYGTAPRIDALGGHCYAVVVPDAQLLTACSTMVDYLNSKATEWGVTGGIWMNEFGPTPNPNQAEMHKQLLETMFYFNSQPEVRRIAIWTLRLATWPTMNTLECNGIQPTSYGAVYRSEIHTVFMPMINK